jgi:uncharacterized MAPEG superfamily protein
MNEAYLYLALSAALLLLQWVPYILNRVFAWGFLTFFNNYPDGYPTVEPAIPLWAARARRAHLNMVETLPAFAVAVLLGAANPMNEALIVNCAMTFFYARVAYAVVYTLGVPFLRTPVYLASWGATLLMLVTFIGQ